MFVIKSGSFYYVGYDIDTEEEIYSSSTYSAMKFNDLDELDVEVKDRGLSGYSVGFYK